MWGDCRTTIHIIAKRLLLTSVLPVFLAAQSTEIVRGKVFDVAQRPIANADVIITGDATGVTRTVRTNRTGAYVAIFTDPEGGYILRFRMVGYAPLTRSVQQAGFSPVLVVADAILTASAIQLAPITASAFNAVPTKGDRPSIGGLEQNLRTGALFSLNPSDLIALTSALPGVLALGDSGFSVLGASPSQNSTLVDGATFGGGSLPRDAIATEKLVTSTFDPSQGQFAGGQTVVTTKRGTSDFVSTLRAEMADPHLAWSDPLAATGAPRIATGSGYLSGPISKGRAWYIMSFDIQQRATETPSLLSPTTSRLAQLGLSPDTLANMTLTLASLGVPLTGIGIPSQPTAIAGSAVLRADYQVSGITSFSMSATGNWIDTRGNGISSLSFPGVSSASRSHFSAFMLKGASYVNGFLEEFQSALSTTTSQGEPNLVLPAASVRVGVSYPDGRSGLTTLRFGGSSSGQNRSSATSWETRNQISLISDDGRHQIKFTQSLREDWNTALQTTNSLGTFSYLTLTDLAANHPASYQRTIFSAEQASRGIVGALSLGDTWRAIPGRLDLQGGVRFDITHFGVTPAYNPLVDSLFAVRTDRLPVDRGFSPRLGFSWTPKGTGRGPTANSITVIDDAGKAVTMSVRGAPGASSASAAGPPSGPFTVTGGVGAFRGLLPPSRIGALSNATGLANEPKYLSCVGDATPVPDWSASGGGAPAQCLDGTAPVAYSSSNPVVTVLDQQFRAPVSWRGNLTVSGMRLHGWSVVPTVIYSAGVAGEGRIDLNLRRTPVFTLPAEANRPVFASPTDIVPGSGLIAPGAARISPSFGQVNSTLADLRTDAAQFAVTLVPPPAIFARLPINLTYVFSRQRAEQRGFGGTTSGDPFVKEWGTGRQPVHQFQLVTNSIRLWWFAVRAQVNVSSGLPYTPMVVGDINGDGLSNDRAFIPTASDRTDPTTAAQFAALLASTPAGARQCLTAQAGRIAAANSCRTPWQARIDIGTDVMPPQPLGVTPRLRVTATMINASEALVRLLGLQNTVLGQSSASANIDSRLLYVTGFDPIAQRFQYRVNQAFGGPMGAGAGQRPMLPFQLQLGLEYKLGGPSLSATARSLGLMPVGRDTALTQEQARTAMRKYTSDPIASILQRRDSLALTVEQIGLIESIDEEFVMRSDTLLAPTVAFVVARGRKLTDAELTSRLSSMRSRIQAMMSELRDKAVALLTPEQRALLAKNPGRIP